MSGALRACFSLFFPLLLMILFSDVIKGERTIFQRETNSEDETKKRNRTKKQTLDGGGCSRGKKKAGVCKITLSGYICQGTYIASFKLNSGKEISG